MDNLSTQRDVAFRTALLEAQAETTTDGLLVVDDDSVRYHNERFLEMWNIPASVADGRSDETILDYVDSLSEHPDNESRETIRLTDGRWLDRYSTPVVGREGTHYGRLWLFRDITERKEQEMRLRETREMLRFVQQTMASSESLTEKMAELLEFGRRYLDVEQGFFTRTTDERMDIRVAAGPNEQLQAGASAPLSETYCRHTIDSETDAPLTVEHASAEDWTDDPAFERFELDCYVGATVVVDDEVHGTICFADREPLDGALTEPQQTFVELLTEWASDELAQRKRERQYRRLTERISDAYYAFDADWTVTYWSDAIADRRGVPAEEIVGTNFWETFPETRGTALEESLREAMQSQEPQVCEFHSEPADCWVRICAYPGDEGISVVSTDITDRKEREQTLERQRDELAQLQRINTLVHEINQALQDKTTRSEIESAVCERLIDSELYGTAWIGTGSQNPSGDSVVVPQTCAGGDEAYLDGISSGIAGPARAALDSGEVQVVTDLTSTDSLAEYRRERALDHDHCAVAAVPLATAETSYGVLVVYAPAGNTIAEQEQDVLADFGRTIARAIQRVHSQRALTADSAVEIELSVSAVDIGFAAVSEQLDCELTLDRRIPASGAGALYYFTVDGAAPAQVCTFLRAESSLSACRIVCETGDAESAVIEAVQTDAARFPTDVLVGHGAKLKSACAVDGVLSYRAEVSTETDIRALVEAVEAVALSVELVSKRVVSRPVTTIPEIKDRIRDQLTPKQEAAVEVAYARGYYSWPRGSTAEEVASVLDIAASTLHYHLRRAHQTMLAALFENADETATQW